MNIVLASDHRGYELKEKIKQFLEKRGHRIIDAGTEGNDRTDYPVYALKGAGFLSSGKSEKGIFICGSGLGICIAANKVKGIRAITARSAEDAAMGVRHNNANIICLGADRTDFEQSVRIVEEFLNNSFEGGRHQNRIDMLEDIENASG